MKEAHLMDLPGTELWPLLRALSQAGFSAELAAILRKPGNAEIAVKLLQQRFSYADEEVESSFGYLSGYQPKGISEQVKVLRELFPGIGDADEKLAEQPLPPGAEGWFAIPRWEKIAPTYGEAVQMAFDLIRETRDGKFYNCREGKIGSEYLRQHERTVVCFKQLADQQSDDDILVLPAQFGLRHRGRSVRRAREVMNASEFGLGAFQIACMILTHPERLQNIDDLWVECSGDEYNCDADRDFSCAPCFEFDDGGVGFGACWIGCPSGYYGSVSAFVPQS